MEPEKVSSLKRLSFLSRLVIDSADLDEIRKFSAVDSTTNPSLVLKALQSRIDKGLPTPLLNEAIQFAVSRACPREPELETQPDAHEDVSQETLNLIIDKLCVSLGCEILKVVPGVVSTEVDARLSFDKAKTMERARRLVSLYEEMGVKRDRILIKIASTWQGILAAKDLEVVGIHCNMTLMFSMTQAIAAANARVTVVSPFVGRITDWHKRANQDHDSPQDDPGVKFVRELYTTFKKHNLPTAVMAASFRNKAQILALAGCDRLTISPKLCEELQNSTDKVVRALDTPAEKASGPLQEMTQSTFLMQLNANTMANEKLAEGIQLFAKDTESLERLVLAAIKRQSAEKKATPERVKEAKVKQPAAADSSPSTQKPQQQQQQAEASKEAQDKDQTEKGQQQQQQQPQPQAQRPRKLSDTHASVYPSLSPTLHPLILSDKDKDKDKEEEQPDVVMPAVPLRSVGTEEEDKHGPLHPESTQPDTIVDAELSSFRADERARRANMREGVGQPDHSTATYIA